MEVFEAACLTPARRHLATFRRLPRRLIPPFDPFPWAWVIPAAALAATTFSRARVRSCHRSHMLRHHFMLSVPSPVRPLGGRWGLEENAETRIAPAAGSPRTEIHAGPVAFMRRRGHSLSAIVATRWRTEAI